MSSSVRTRVSVGSTAGLATVLVALVMTLGASFVIVSLAPGGTPDGARSSGLATAAACTGGGFFNHSLVQIVANVTSGPAPLAVSFCGAVNGTATAYAWDFGDGGRSTAQSVNYTYVTPGTYTVNFTAILTGGQQASTYLGISVQAAQNGSQPLAVALYAYPSDATPPYTVHVNATVATCQGGCTLNFSATNLYNGSTINGPQNLTTGSGFGAVSTSFTIPGPGIWNIAASATDTANDSGIGYVPVIGNLTTQVLNVVLSPDPNASSGLTSVLNASVTGAASPPVNLSWWFGDGTVAASAGPNATMSHTYAAAGSYSVQVFAQDRSNNDGSVGATVTVGNSTGRGPIGIVAFAIPLYNSTTNSSNYAYRFVANASGGTPPYQYRWGFGDGSNGSGSVVTHQYAINGTYNVVVLATDSQSLSGNYSMTLVIAPAGNSAPPITVSASYTPSGTVPYQVTVHANASGGRGAYQYAWSLGDGTNGTGQNVTHTYAANGTYTAVVNVSDPYGDFGIGSVTIHLGASQGNNSSLVLRLSATSVTGPAPLNTTFTASVSGGNGPYTLVLSTGVGRLAATNWSGASLSFSTTYSSAGNFTAVARAVDQSGANATASLAIQVSGAAPLHGSAIESGTSGQAPFSVGFAVTATGGLPPYQVTWHWGDGTTASSGVGVLVLHTYSAAGMYAPSAVVSDSAQHTVIIALEAVAVAPLSTSGGHAAGGAMTISLAYLGIGGVFAALAAVAVGGLLRRRHQRTARALARAWEQPAEPFPQSDQSPRPPGP